MTAKQSPLPHSSKRNPVQSNPTSDARAPRFRRSIGNRVPYGQGRLGSHVAGMRTPTGRPPTGLDPSMNRNIAAAKLSDGKVIDGV
ncbi:MAG TPA: hypothetical protein VHG10_05930, partial [Glycomyces sp.]|nr:hypothetical protein [Glycomyces sp.]